MKKEYSLVLEGGGAKGAYQVGAIKALKEAGYEFNTIIGTSIGALNAAFICQQDTDKLEELWNTLSFQDLMNINNDLAEHLVNRQINSDVINEVTPKIKEAFKQKGIDTNKIRKILEKYIDENKIRNSSIRFGLVTYCITDMTPKRLFIEDIPYGKLIDYLLATSNLPVFKRQKIDNKRFLDGGTYDNCSVEMLYEAGYRDIIAIRIFKRRNRIRNYNKLSKIKDLNLKIILPSEELSSILNFNSENLKNMLEYGYIDTIKQLKGLDGNKYAIEKIGIDKIEKIKNIFTPSFSYELVKKIGVKYKIGENIIDVAINRGMKKINNSISNNKTKSFKKQLINMIEYVLLKENTFKNKIYTLDEVILIAKKILEKNANNEIEQAIYYIIENIS